MFLLFEGGKENIVIVQKKISTNKNVFFSPLKKAKEIQSHLAWADFKIKVKQIAHSTLRFDQWIPQISKIFPQLFFYSDQHAFWNFIENKNDENSIMKSYKN